MDLSGPCDWPSASCTTCDTDCLTASQRQALELEAQTELWEATGRVYGTCSVTVFPCNDYSVLCGCGRSLRSCGCRSVPEVKLAGPVHSVTEVVVAGETLDPEDYRIDDYQWLVRTDGGTWPANADPLDPDAFSVTYLLGVEPPAGAARIIGLLVCSRGHCSGGCTLPKNTTQVSRQGVTMVREVNQFGIVDVDNWVRNANAPTRAGAVHSPDLPYVRRTTWAST